LVNSLGSKRVFDLAAKNQNTRVVYASTSEVYGDPQIHPQIESYWGNVNSFGPRSCYDESKRFGEALGYTYLHKYQTDLRIVRIFNTYGPKMEKNDGRVVSNFIVAAIKGKPLLVSGDGQQTRSFCYVSDLVNALVLMGEKPVKGEIINLGNPNELTILGIAEKIIQLTGSNSKVVFQPLPTDDPKKRKPNISKAQNLLGWQPKIKLEDGLVKTIAYFKQILES
jgi:nucleoside-diphosphate-sugar epimerase